MSMKNVIKQILPKSSIAAMKSVRQIFIKDDVSKFLNWYFKSDEENMIFQVGANDGEMCDPLRRYLSHCGNYKAILIEPLPFYVDKLRELYSDRSDVRIIQAACGRTEEVKKLYFIPPHIADTMNGNGPANNWAHGQGSFDKRIVIHWIHENKFRGADYIRQIPFFVSAIESIDVDIKKTASLMPKSHNLLMVIDVQGFELEVLEGVEWDSNPPRYILLEDDLDRSKQVADLLKTNGYSYVCGNTDKVFARN